jgi:hypothetical protein
MTLIGGSSEVKTIAVGVLLAALYAVLAAVPLTPFIGASSLLSLAILIAPLFGLLLGPWKGLVFGFLGGITATMVSTLTLGGGVYLLLLPTILGPGLAGLFVGLSLHPRTQIGVYRVPGPILTALYLVFIILLYEIPNFSAWWFMLPYILAAVVAFALQFKKVNFNPLSEGVKKYLQLFPLTLIGAMVDHSMMAMGAVYILEIPAIEFGLFIFPIMIIERISAIIISAIVASVIITVFQTEEWIYNPEAD